MHCSSCNDYAQSHKGLTTIITEYPNGEQFHGNDVSDSKRVALNMLLALSLFNLTHISSSFEDNSIFQF